MNTTNSKFFNLGLILFYFLLFFAPHKLVYFSAYFVGTFFFYLSTGNFIKSLVYSLILSLFSEIGLAASWFIMEPREFNLGSGYVISPTTLVLIPLIYFAIRNKMLKIQKADICIFLFYAWSLVSFLFWPYLNSLFGVFQLTEIVLVYFILRTFLEKNDFHIISKLLLSMLIFQLVLGGIQIVLRKPVGTVSESTSIETPYGITASEDDNLSRTTGTFGHPNLYAAYLLAMFPMLFISSSSSIILLLTKTLFLTGFIFTYSRAGWVIFAVMYAVSYGIGYFKKNFKRVHKVTFILIAFLILLMSPLIVSRMESSIQAFDENGSMGVRFKLFTEATELIKQFPIFGVGLNRSFELYAANPATDIFTVHPTDAFYRIHNMFLEIGTEIGIPGIIFFMLFLIFSILSIRNKDTYQFQKSAVLGLFGLIAISMLHPFFHSSQFRLYFLLTALILT